MLGILIFCFAYQAYYFTCSIATSIRPNAATIFPAESREAYTINAATIINKQSAKAIVPEK